MAFLKTGSPSRTRTYNLVVNSHPLCRLSYRGAEIPNKIFLAFLGGIVNYLLGSGHSPGLASHRSDRNPLQVRRNGLPFEKMNVLKWFRRHSEKGAQGVNDSGGSIEPAMPPGSALISPRPIPFPDPAAAAPAGSRSPASEVPLPPRQTP